MDLNRPLVMETPACSPGWNCPNVSELGNKHFRKYLFTSTLMRTPALTSVGRHELALDVGINLAMVCVCVPRDENGREMPSCFYIC